MRLQTSPGDEPGFEKARDWLLNGFGRWLRAERSVDKAAADDAVGDASMALDWKFNYDDGHLGQWQTGDVTGFLLGWCPRKLSVSRADCVTIPGNFAAFTDYLAAEGLLAAGSASAARLREAIADVTDEFVAAMGDPTKFGMAKSLFGAALVEGVDLTDPEQMNSWAADFNARSFGERRRILPDSAFGPTGPAGPAGPPSRPPLPPVVLPADDVIEASKAAAPVLKMFADLAGHVGAGRPLTQKGNLALADARVLIGLLGTGDVMDETIGDRSFRTQSSAELPRLCLVFAWAKKAGVVRVRHGKVMATKRGLALAGDPAGLFDRAADALLDIGPLSAQRNPAGWLTWPEVDELLDSFAIQLLIGPYTTQRPMPLDEMARVAADVIIGAFEFHDLADELVAQRIGWNVTDIVDALELAGVTRRTGLAEDGQAPGRRRAGGNVELTPAGIATVQRRLRELGYDAPGAGRLSDASAAELLAGTDAGDLATLSSEIEAWRRRRTPEQAVRELADAVRELADPALRNVALAAMADIAPEVAAPFVRRLAEDRVARGFALCWLVDHDFEDPRVLYDPADPDTFTEVLTHRLVTAQTDGLIATLALAGDQGQQIRAVGELGQSSSPAADFVLDAIGSEHPAKVVAKAARKALFRRRTRRVGH